MADKPVAGLLSGTVGAGDVPGRGSELGAHETRQCHGAGREVPGRGDRLHEAIGHRVVVEPDRRGGQVDEQAGEFLTIAAHLGVVEQGCGPGDDLGEPVDLGERADHGTFRGHADRGVVPRQAQRVLGQ